MAFTRTWDAAYEALPTDANYMYEVDNFIRQVLVDVRERMEIDHIWKVGATDGEHKKITFSAQIAKPSNVANQGFLYTKDVSAKAELHWEDEDGNELVVTKGGRLANLESGTHGIFYQNTAPTYWTIHDTLDDKLLFITKGSAAGGQTGGGAHSTGSWTLSGITITNAEIVLDATMIPAHVHTGPSHTHTTSIYGAYAEGAGQAGYYGVEYTNGVAGQATGGPVTPPTNAAGTGNTSSVGGGLGHTHVNTLTLGSTWRPAAYCAIICAKD